MRIRTILNKKLKNKSFVYTKEFIEKKQNQEVLIVEIAPRKNSKPTCPGCGQNHSTYDHQHKSRDFAFPPMWGIPVFFRYRMRRVDCPNCGIKVEEVPWADGKSPITKTQRQFLSFWAKKMSWQEVARTFKSSWYHVYTSVKQTVDYGLAYRDLSDIKTIGVDEVHYGKNIQYLTMFYQLDNGRKRLLFAEPKRTCKSLLKCFRGLGKENSLKVKYVCSDMWKPYLKVIKKKCPNALNILDRFHIVKKLNESVNKVRIIETKRLKDGGFEPILAKSKYCFLKKEENLTFQQSQKLEDVLQYDLTTVDAYLFKVGFEAFWQYKSPYWASWFLEKWCDEVNDSDIEPMKKFVRTVQNHRGLIMNWFRAKKAYSSGTVEGLNRKVNLVTRKSYGFRSVDVLRIALFHTMGDLPEPEMTHLFF